ncbi:hypothetical protein D9M71_466250 [compost metagenome]
MRSIEIVAVIQLDKRPAGEVPFVVESAHSITGLVLVEPFVTLGLHALGGVQQHIAPVQSEQIRALPHIAIALAAAGHIIEELPGVQIRGAV